MRDQAQQREARRERSLISSCRIELRLCVETCANAGEETNGDGLETPVVRASLSKRKFATCDSAHIDRPVHALEIWHGRAAK
jgi:hypothetical protein